MEGRPGSDVVDGHTERAATVTLLTDDAWFSASGLLRIVTASCLVTAAASAGMTHQANSAVDELRLIAGDVLVIAQGTGVIDAVDYVLALADRSLGAIDQSVAQSSKRQWSSVSGWAPRSTRPGTNGTSRHTERPRKTIRRRSDHLPNGRSPITLRTPWGSPACTGASRMDGSRRNTDIEGSRQQPHVATTG